MAAVGLETPLEEVISDLLQKVASQALAGDTQAQANLCALWPSDSWETIAEKLRTEGSAYYVWWADGVRAFISGETDPSKGDTTQ